MLGVVGWAVICGFLESTAHLFVNALLSLHPSSGCIPYCLSKKQTKKEKKKKQKQSYLMDLKKRQDTTQ